ncbi:MAG: glutamine synthetase [Clostridia bacterium]|nr:glutamine synthetase [Clostridia bacterium]
MLNNMIFCLPANKHKEAEIRQCLQAHPEIRFVSLCGLDINGDETDEKIPVENMLDDIDHFLKFGVQTDGSSVFLPKIAEINNAKVDILPDFSVNWYVDYNYQNIDSATGLPVGTLRIPAYLVHNDKAEVGSRIILRDAIKVFETELVKILKENPYVFEFLPFDSVEDIEEIKLTAATELEFYVKTPDDVADKDRLHTSQELKEQYWKRTLGPVRTALERTLDVLNRYGFEIEMAHKEVGGVKPKLMHDGDFDHIMEQLEIDWKYSDPMQAADNDKQIRYIVKDIFRNHGLDVTFMAKPIEGVAGSGKHTHMGVAAKLKDGRMVNLFTAGDVNKDYLSPLGYACLMGLLKNYEIVSPMANCTNDAYNRLKPGFEAPVSIVTSLGHSVEAPSRNRTVLVGLIRDMRNPLATRFELRAPNPKSNTYLVLTAAYMAMLDGIRAALKNKKTPTDLYHSISKAFGVEDFYLEKNRQYRTEKNIFDDYTQEERENLFGKAPATAWEALKGLTLYPEKAKLLFTENVMDVIDLESYKAAAISQWSTELYNRIIPNLRENVRECEKLHDSLDCADLDEVRWKKIRYMRKFISQDTTDRISLLTKLALALDKENYDEASDLQLQAQKKVSQLNEMYAEYKRNLL